MREPRFSPIRFLRERQYSWLEYYAFIQAELVGGVRLLRKAGVWSDVWRHARRMSARLFERPDFKSQGIRTGPNLPADLEAFEANAHEWLSRNYNEVYLSEAYRDHVLGMIAAELRRQGLDLNELKRLDLVGMEQAGRSAGILERLEDLDRFGEETGVKQSSAWARLWSDREAGRWLAIYDDQGQRAGRSYEVVRDMVRDVVNQAIDEDLPIDKIRQRLFARDWIHSHRQAAVFCL